ncbi:MAG: hypothetical protein ACE5Z5_05800 [Candidatus Bathyarchaeia archaeon]
MAEKMDPLRQFVTTAEDFRASVTESINSLLESGVKTIRETAPELPAPPGVKGSPEIPTLPAIPRVEEVLATLPELPKLPGIPSPTGGRPEGEASPTRREEIVQKEAEKTYKAPAREGAHY